MRWLRFVLAGLVLGWCVSLPLHAQPGPFSAQIQLLLNGPNTWAQLQTFSNGITVTGACTGCGGVTFPLQAPDGTQGAPSYSWTNESTSGWWRGGAGQFVFSIANSPKLNLTASV